MRKPVPGYQVWTTSDRQGIAELFWMVGRGLSVAGLRAVADIARQQRANNRAVVATGIKKNQLLLERKSMTRRHVPDKRAGTGWSET